MCDQLEPISKTQDSNGMSRKSPREGPAWMVQWISGASNQTNDSFDKGLHVKIYGKGVYSPCHTVASMARFSLSSFHFSFFSLKFKFYFVSFWGGAREAWDWEDRYERNKELINIRGLFRKCLFLSYFLFILHFSNSWRKATVAKTHWGIRSSLTFCSQNLILKKKSQILAERTKWAPPPTIPSSECG